MVHQPLTNDILQNAALICMIPLFPHFSHFHTSVASSTTWPHAWQTKRPSKSTSTAPASQRGQRASAAAAAAAEPHPWAPPPWALPPRRRSSTPSAAATVLAWVYLFRRAGRRALGGGARGLARKTRAPRLPPQIHSLGEHQIPPRPRAPWPPPLASAAAVRPRREHRRAPRPRRAPPRAQLKKRSEEACGVGVGVGMAAAPRRGQAVAVCRMRGERRHGAASCGHYSAKRGGSGCVGELGGRGCWRVSKNRK